jgi:hypothetical protein
MDVWPEPSPKVDRDVPNPAAFCISESKTRGFAIADKQGFTEVLFDQAHRSRRPKLRGREQMPKKIEQEC